MNSGRRDKIVDSAEKHVARRAVKSRKGADTISAPTQLCERQPLRSKMIENGRSWFTAFLYMPISTLVNAHSGDFQYQTTRGGKARQARMCILIQGGARQEYVLMYNPAKEPV